MKRVFFIMLMSILTIGIVKAQNANRSGFFMELGIGGFVGNTPRTSFSIEDNVMKLNVLMELPQISD